MRERARDLDLYRSPFTIFFKTEPLLSRQSKLVVNAILVAEVSYLEELASLAIYVGGRLLSFFNKKYLTALINRLNLSFKIPLRQRFFNDLLDKAYNKMRTFVQT